MQKVLHEVRQPPGFLIDDRQRAAALLVGAHAAERQRLRKHPDLGERCAQLVRDAGNEIGAEARQLGFAAQLEERGPDKHRCQSEQAEDQRQP